MSDAIRQLYEAVLACRGQDPSSSKTARQLATSRKRMARKIGEEAVEVAIEAVVNHREAVVAESVDLLHRLAVLWVAMDIDPAEIAAEVTRRERPPGTVARLPRRAA
jgi:phosphoribosyl-ATP pyrophosphohydrolase